MKKRYVLWDFDGTLAARPGNWGSAIQEAALLYPVAKELCWERVVPLLSYGLPWHEPGIPHRNLSSPQLWWEHVERAIADKFSALGYEEQHLLPLAKLTRQAYINPNRWITIDGAPEVLASLRRTHWANIIVTNHVPEVSDILQSLLLSEYVTKIFCSAELGIEKPHPEFFPSVLAALGSSRDVWVIGDSEAADIAPAHALGLRTVLVGGVSKIADACVSHLSEIPDILMNQ
jgi:HAD superfamily hydrolase (TIGR01549 family)